MSTDTGTHTPFQEEPESARAGHRRTRSLGIALGAVAGLVVGIVILLVFDIWHVTGSGSNPAAYVFGLPAFTLVCGAVIGWLLAGIGEHGVVDAPVRSERFARQGVAATSVEGQLPGSPVPPRTRPGGTGPTEGLD